MQRGAQKCTLRGVVAGMNHMNLTTENANEKLCAFTDEERDRIKVLQMFDNRLDSLPDAVRLLTNLEELYIRSNCITQLPDWIGNLTTLKHLSAARNHLRGLPESIGNLTNLEVLYLNGNQLSSLPSSISRLTKLFTLYLKANRGFQENANYKMSTQMLLGKIVLKNRKEKAYAAFITWFLVGKRMRIYKDLVHLIAKFIFVSNIEDVWD